MSLLDRNESISLIDEACVGGARRFKCCELLELSLRTLERWELTPGIEDGRKGPNHSPQAKKILLSLSPTVRSTVT